MTPLEQFNEEVKKEYLKLYPGVSETIAQNEINFIIQKLAAHKELILKMVREKAPGERFIDSEMWTKRDVDSWNDYREEFLNNLDTI